MSILPNFRLVTYFSQWEFKARHHMAASDAQTIALSELLSLADPEDREAWDKLTLGYTETRGAPALRRAVAATYAGLAPEDILCFAGAEEGIYCAMLAMQRGGTIAYYQADGLGSITSLTDGSGKALSTYVYKAFGSTTANEGVFSPFRYTGREQDPETGLYYYRARYYDPTIGRFLSEDPIGFKGSGTNFYAYVRNSSVNVNDPFGLCPQCDNIPSTGRTVPLSTSSGQWNLQFNSAGTLIGLGIPLNTGNTAINSGSLSIGPNTYAGITLNANGSVSFGFSNAILINNGLSSAYFSSATYSGGQYTQVNGTWGPFGIPVPLPSGWVLNAANGSSSAVNLGDFLSAAINLLSQFNCQDLFGQ